MSDDESSSSGSDDGLFQGLCGWDEDSDNESSDGESQKETSAAKASAKEAKKVAKDAAKKSAKESADAAKSVVREVPAAVVQPLPVAGQFAQAAAPAEAKSEDGRLRVTLSFTGSLDDLAARGNEVVGHMVCNNSQLADIVGGERFHVGDMRIEHFDAQQSPVTLGVRPNAKICGKIHASHVTDTGLASFTMPRRSMKDFAVPLKIQECERKKSATDLRSTFPDATVDNISAAVSAVGYDKNKLAVAKDSAIASSVRTIIDKAIEAARIAGEVYTGPTLEASWNAAGKVYELPKKYVIAATNLAAAELTSASDEINVEDLTLEFSRAIVGADAATSSRTSAVWLNPNELRMSLKDGNVYVAETAKPFTISAVVSFPDPKLQ